MTNALSLYTIAAEYRHMVERLMERIEKTATCWSWKAGCSKNGYGAIRFNGKQEGAHRVSYTVFKGPIPDGMHVMHSCDNKKCINPDHLNVGTRFDNMKDCAHKNRNYIPTHFRGDSNPSAKIPGIRKGARNGRAKLNEQKVALIRKLMFDGATAYDTAQAFGVSRSTVQSIIRNKTWAV